MIRLRAFAVIVSVLALALPAPAEPSPQVVREAARAYAVALQAGINLPVFRDLFALADRSEARSPYECPFGPIYPPPSTEWQRDCAILAWVQFVTCCDACSTWECAQYCRSQYDNTMVNTCGYSPL